MAVNPKKGLLMWREYSDSDLDFFIANVGNTIRESQALIPKLQDTIMTWQLQAEQVQYVDERARLDDTISATRAEIKSLSNRAKLLDGNKRAAMREWEEEQRQVTELLL